MGDDGPEAGLLEGAPAGARRSGPPKDPRAGSRTISAARGSGVERLRKHVPGEQEGPAPPASPRKREEGTVWARVARLILVPERGSWVVQWVTGWEFLMSFLTIACAYLIPFSLALPTVATPTLSWLNTCSDVCFTADLCLQFFLAYRNPEESHSDMIWEKDPAKIARRYCSFPLSEKGQAGWFWLDLLSVLPGWLAHCLGPEYETVMKMVRFLRLIRMIRLTRLSRKIEEGQATTGVPFFFSDILKFVFITTFVSHAAACTWVMIEARITNSIFIEKQSEHESWLSALRNAKGDCCTPDAENDPLCVYNLALYWAMMTLTTVGYGDITPQNPCEYFVCTLFMLIAGFVWAYIVGSVVSLLSQLDPDNARFKQSMDKLNALIEQRNLSSGLRCKLREYMVVAKSIGQIHHQQNLLEQHISQGLQREVVMETPVMQTFLKKVYWARDLEPDALLEIIRSLKSYVYGKEETIPMKDRMILVREGIVAVKGRILGRNEVHGENSILLMSDHLVAETMPRTLSYVTALALTKQALMGVCEQYPSVDRRLRHAQIRTAAWRGFVHAASKERAAAKPKADRDILKPRGSFVAAVTRTNNLDSVVTAEELKEVEGRLGRGQRDLTDQLVETRELLNSQMDMMNKIAHDMKSQAFSGSSAARSRGHLSPK